MTRIQISCFFTVVLLLCVLSANYAQEFTLEEQAQLDELDEALSSYDSTGLIYLIDSLIRLEESLIRPQLVIKSGYNNETLSYRQESLGYENSYYTGLSFYHNTGLFIGLTGNWNSQFDPGYYLTKADIGYIGTPGIHWKYLVSYEHFFFNKAAENETIYFPYTDALNSSFYYINKYFQTGITYSAIFGEENTLHQLSYQLTGDFSIKTNTFIELINIRPTFGFLLGNQSVYSIKIDRRFLDPRKRYTLVENNVFGLMNISINMPAYVLMGPVSLNLAYQFNLPQELAGEELAYTNSNVFSVGLSYFIKL